MDTEEVSVTRKYYRGGEGEYFINGNRVRLKDIYELFLDTGLGKSGYSIVGQGKISQIVTAKPENRREIFEEASGISKYRYRKNEAEKKLQSAEGNITRLSDILMGLEERVEPLRIQSEKAQKFIVLSEEKKELEVSLWIDSLTKLSEKLEQQEAQSILAKNKWSDTEAVLEEYAARLEESYGQVQRCTVEIEALLLHKRIYLGPIILPNKRPAITTTGTGISENNANFQLIPNIITTRPIRVNA